MEKLPENPSVTLEIDRLREMHTDLDRRLKELESHLWLSADEQGERARLKKQKLLTKDRLARLSSILVPRA